MKISPIIMSTPMVTGILEGRKTVTRRVVKSRHSGIRGDGKFHPIIHEAQRWVNSKDSNKWAGFNGNIMATGWTDCPYGEVGDILWVRESFYESVAPDGIGYPAYYFKVSHDGKIISTDDNLKWRPSIHMPKAACRIFLKITGVRVERLQEITESDAIAEGVTVSPEETKSNTFHRERLKNRIPAGDHQLRFCNLWRELHYTGLQDQINKKDSWSLNPWVWVITFERTGKPEKF